MALRGIKVIEMIGLGPGPFCGTILADFGANVTVVQRITDSPFDLMSQGKKMMSIDLKTEQGTKIMKKLCESSDVLLDTYRPGVMEKLGLGPETLIKKNTRLIYARLSGYGQKGEYQYRAGHDINYIAMSGILSMLSKNGHPPSPPVNLTDFAGGSVVCALGIVLALFERSKSGKGQIIDSNITEGTAYIGTWLFKSRNLPIWSGPPGTNVLDGGSPFYRTYKTSDSKFMAVGALEPQFYSNFILGLGLNEEEYAQTDEVERCEKKFTNIFMTKTQKEWTKIFENIDACVTPVLDIDMLESNKHHMSRRSFFRDQNGFTVPDSSPKLSLTPAHSVSNESLPKPGQHTIEILKTLGYKKGEIDNLIGEGIVYAHKNHICNLN